MNKIKVSVELNYNSNLIFTIKDNPKSIYISHQESVWRFWQMIKDYNSTIPVLTSLGVAFEANIPEELFGVIKKFDGIR
ncbi:hypothetical protein [Sphingobacterium multivorum]|uniref:hypothetical protein n=1 Tax=Sphingobacterium multivorum TaxID=28454 RepID=UPI00369C8E9B